MHQNYPSRKLRCCPKPAHRSHCGDTAEEACPRIQSTGETLGSAFGWPLGDKLAGGRMQKPRFRGGAVDTVPDEAEMLYCEALALCPASHVTCDVCAEIPVTQTSVVEQWCGFQFFSTFGQVILRL